MDVVICIPLTVKNFKICDFRYNPVFSVIVIDYVYIIIRPHAAVY